MAALSANRNTARMGDHVIPDVTDIPVDAAKHIFQGSLVVLNAGYLQPGSTATGLIAAGVALEEVDNSAGSQGALTCPVRQGVFKFDNSSAGDLIAQANVGADCYIVDDHTVALTSGTNTRSRAGKIRRIDTDGGVFVQIGIGV